MSRRREMHLSRPTVVIMGAPFSSRTLHPPDARRDPEATEHTIDRVVTLTLSAIPGLHHYEPASMMVELT